MLCPQCGYLLRGLPDGACPECGKRFERGRLLVQQYVKNIPWKQTWAGKWMWRLVILALTVQGLGILGFRVLNHFVPSSTPGRGNRYGLYVLAISLLISLVAFLMIIPILVVAGPRDILRRRRAIVDAIARTQGD